MKQSEITKLSKEDLQDKLVEYQKQLKDLKMTHAISPLENPLQIKTTRRVVARLQTALSNQEALRHGN
ncbi:MAG: 50S ribosomal protein L29 [Flavobacteriaceae bacterium]|nr:50S ribosomal protein L29 [Flavobacteriaceae bacterium]